MMQKTFLLQLLIALMSLAILFGILYFARSVLMPLAVAGILTMLFLPMSKKMERIGVNRILAAVICSLFFLFLIVGIAALISYRFAYISNNISLIRENISGALNKIRQYLIDLNISTKKNHINGSAENHYTTFTIAYMIGSILKVIVGIMLTVIYTALMLINRTHFKNFILKLVPEVKVEKTKIIIDQCVGMIQQYLFALFTIIAMLWIMYSIAFSIIGINNPIFFATICAALEVVPFVGNITGCTIASLMALSQGGGISMVLAVIGTYCVIHFLQFYIVSPIIIGSRININPLFNILIIFVGALLWGVPGMILSIPFLGIAKIICDNVDPLKPYGYLIGCEEQPHRLALKIKNYFRKKEA
jgi:predicted PurR-regulated permease PerM